MTPEEIKIDARFGGIIKADHIDGLADGIISNRTNVAFAIAKGTVYATQTGTGDVVFSSGSNPSVDDPYGIFNAFLTNGVTFNRDAAGSYSFFLDNTTLANVTTFFETLLGDLSTGLAEYFGNKYGMWFHFPNTPQASYTGSYYSINYLQTNFVSYYINTGTDDVLNNTKCNVYIFPALPDPVA